MNEPEVILSKTCSVCSDNARLIWTISIPRLPSEGWI